MIVLHNEVVYGAEELESLTITEITSPSGNVIPFNTMNVRIKLADSVNINKFVKFQQISVYTDQAKLQGVFYIFKAKRAQDKKVNAWDIVAYDLAYILKQEEFSGGYYVEESITNMLNLILKPSTGAYNFDYTLLDNTENRTITGYIPSCTMLDALTYVQYACGVYMDRTRLDKVQVRLLSDTVEYDPIDIDGVFSNNVENVAPKEKATINTVNYSSPSVDTNAVELFNSIIPAGVEYKLVLDPHDNFSIVNGQYTVVNLSKVLITSINPSEVTILKGKPLTKSIVPITKTIPGTLSTGYGTGILKDENTLVSLLNASTVLEAVLREASVNNILTIDSLGDEIPCGSKVVVNAPIGQCIGRITQQKISYGKNVVRITRQVQGTILPPQENIKLGERYSDEDLYLS